MPTSDLTPQLNQYDPSVGRGAGLVSTAPSSCHSSPPHSLRSHYYLSGLWASANPFLFLVNPTCLPRPSHSCAILYSLPCPSNSPCLLLWACLHVTLGTDYKPLCLPSLRLPLHPEVWLCVGSSLHLVTLKCQATQTCVCGAQQKPCGVDV